MENSSQDSSQKGAETIELVSLKTALEERYLSYALSTIMNRALPDVRDGLKPVHRRIIHAMRQLRLYPDRSLAKCARIVGEVMGKFHPHGDQSIYDALVRLAQDFSMRYPLIEGQGNFGNIDGDNAAAMRYTEARMTKVCAFLLEGIAEDAVDFRATYNEEDEEPIVLPGAFPNLLANGSSGIAVGMATSIPPHNVAELCCAALHLIENPNAAIEELIACDLQAKTFEPSMVRGPDFPTGGVLIDDQKTILQFYKTGRGSFRLRAKWHVEEQSRGAYQIVVTEIPYGIQKSRLIEKIAQLLFEKKLPLLEDVRDESAEEIRLILVPKNRSVDATLLMEVLFKQSDLESRFSLNMNVLSHGKIPRVLSLKAILKEWLDHRCQVLVRRSVRRLAEICQQLEILSGHLIACLNIDAVIEIIREEEDPKSVLMQRWSLTPIQADTILDLRLRQLRKLEEIEIQKKYAQLEEEKKQVDHLLASEKKQWSIIRSEIERVQEAFGSHTAIGRRRTIFSSPPSHNHADIQKAMVEKEPVTVVVSEKGWMRTIKGHLENASSLSFKEEDSLKCLLQCWTTDKILLFSTKGKFYTIDVARLPSGRGHGEPVRIIVDMEKEQDIVSVLLHNPSYKILLISRNGYGFFVDESDLVANTRKGKQVMNLSSSDQAALCLRNEGDHVALVGKNRKMVIFSLAEIPIMSRGKGVRLQKYQDSFLLAAKIFTIKEGLVWADSSGKVFKKNSSELLGWITKRGVSGRLLPHGFMGYPPLFSKTSL